MRLFIAFDVPAGIKEYLHGIQEKLNGNALFSMTREFHMTLKFLGEVPEENISKIAESLKEVRFKPFKTSLDNIGFFPSGDYIRVVWVGLNPFEEIIWLQQQVDSSLSTQFQKEGNFKPHITLARVKLVKNKEAFLRNLKSIKMLSQEFEVSEFKLIKSTLTPQGPVYEDIETFKAAKHL